MNGNDRPDMNDWEDQINALLDGELDDAEAEALKSAAEQDQSLARAIIEAYQLQQALANIAIEPAPPSLRRKLKRVPRQQRARERRVSLPPRWVAALALIPLVVIGISQLGPREPSEEEIAQARQDLAIAFAYLGKVGRRTGLEIESTVGEEMNDAVTGNMVKTIEDQLTFRKEQEA